MKMHIGQEIERRFQESGLKLTVFAEKINTGERNVYSIFKREDISAEMLSKISEVLGHDFFSLYQKKLSPKIKIEGELQKAQTIKFLLTLEIDINKYDELPSMLKDVTFSASKYGIRIL